MLDIIMHGDPANPAILAPERPPLTYGDLQDLATDSVGRLNALGIGRNDRVAILLPNGPEMAASDLGVPVIRLEVDDGAPAGAFRLSGEAIGETRSSGPAQRDDIALVLHTSGTTSRPKIVPLTHANLAASAENIRR